MVKELKNYRGAGEGAGGHTASEGVFARLVNSGHDTQITLDDGSTIVLKGVAHIEAVSALVLPEPSGGEPAAVGGDVGGDR
jgi:hypothetical protein